MQKFLPTYKKQTVSAVLLTLVRYYSLTGGPRFAMPVPRQLPHRPITLF